MLAIAFVLLIAACSGDDSPSGPTLDESAHDVKGIVIGQDGILADVRWKNLAFDDGANGIVVQQSFDITITNQASASATLDVETFEVLG